VRRLSVSVHKKHELIKDLATEVGLLQESLRQLSQAESSYVRDHVRNALARSNERMSKGVVDEN